MNSQAPILMSAETAWPRRPTPRASSYTSPRPSTRDVPETPTSLGPINSILSSPYGDEDDNDHAEKSVSIVRQTTPRWRKNLDPTSRLDPQKIARIAQAFGVNLSLPQSRSLDSHSPLLNSLALPSSSCDRHSQQRSVSTSSSVFSAHSAGLISRAPSPLLSPAGSVAYAPLSPRRAIAKPKHLICVSPPPILKSHYSESLILLQSTYKAQLEVIAREYRLPTTVGLVLFLVINTLPSEERPSREATNSSKKHRPRKTRMKIGQNTWGLLWEDIFDSSSAYNHQGSNENAAISPKSATQSLPTSHLTPLPAVYSHDHSPETLPHKSSAPRASSSSVPIGLSPAINHIPPFSRLSPIQTNNPQSRPDPSGKSLLHRSPSSLSPASLTKQKRPPVSLSRRPVNRTPTSTFNPPDSTTLNRTLQPAQPLSSTHSLAPSIGEQFGINPNFKPPELRIVGSLEFGIDGDRAGEWWDAWIKKKGISLNVREDEIDSEEDEENINISEVGVQTVPSKFSGENKEASSFEDSFEEENGYARLEDEGDEKDDGTREREIDDLLEGMLPSDELEWTRLRDSRDPSSAFRKGRGDLQLSAEELSLPSFSSFRHSSEPHEGAKTDEFTLNAEEVNSMLAAHPISGGVNPDSSDFNAREGSALRRPKNSNWTLGLDSTISPPAASLVLGLSTRSNINNPSLKRSVVKSAETEGLPNMETMSSVRIDPFGIGEVEDEVRNRGSALLMHDKLNDLENILRSLSPRDLSIPSRSHTGFNSLAGQTDQALLSPATIDASDPMDGINQSTGINSSSKMRSAVNGASNSLPPSSTQSINGYVKDPSSASTSPAISAVTHSYPFDNSLLPIQKNTLPVQLPRASSYRSLEDTDSLSIRSRLSERLWAFPREKGSPGRSPYDSSAEHVLDLNEHVGFSDTPPSPQRLRTNSAKSSKGFRGFRWGRSSEESSPPLPAEISAPMMSRPDMPAISHTTSLSSATTDLNDHYRYGESSSPLINQFGQRMDITPDMNSSGFSESMILPSPTSPKDGKGSAGHSSKKRFKAPFSPGQLFGSKNHKQRLPMEISAPELISINNQAPNGLQSMTAFHHQSKPEQKASQGMKGSPSMQALQRQQQQDPGKLPFTEGLQSPPTSPNSIGSPSSPRTVRRKPVPGIPSASPSIASLSQQMHRMSSASEDFAFSPRSGTGMGNGIEAFTSAPPLPDSPLKTIGLGAQTEEARSRQRSHVVGLGLTRQGLDESEGLA